MVVAQPNEPTTNSPPSVANNSSVSHTKDMDPKLAGYEESAPSKANPEKFASDEPLIHFDPPSGYEQHPPVQKKEQPPTNF